MTQTTTSKQTTEPIDDDLVLTDVLTELREHLAVLAVRRAELPPGAFDPDLASATAMLAKAALAGIGERRQRAKARQRELAQIPFSELVDYVRGLPEEKREGLIQAITRTTNTGSLFR